MAEVGLIEIKEILRGSSKPSEMKESILRYFKNLYVAPENSILHLLAYYKYGSQYGFSAQEE